MVSTTTRKTKTSRHREARHPHSVPVLESEDEAAEMPDQPFAEGARDPLDPDLRHRMVSEAAYRRYSGRGYTDGYDLDDWLQAEADVDHLLLNRAGAE
ncbi:MAG TPA: DUF2934 domain-containing protein [Casimicrobiaceae bacterium]